MPIIGYVEVVFALITQDFLRLKHTLVARAIKRKNNFKPWIMLVQIILFLVLRMTVISLK